MKKTFCVFGLLVAFVLGAVLLNNRTVQAENKPVAIVNGKKLFSDEVEKKLQRYKGLDPATLSSYRMEIIDEMIIQTLIEQFFQKEGINIPSQEVEDKVINLRENLKTNPKTATFTLEELLEASGSSLEELKEEIKITLGFKTYFEKATSEKTLRDYFSKNKDTYSGEMVRASHILVDTRLTESPEDLNKAKQKIESIKKELDGGVDFAELAQKYSDCPSSKQGGDIGFFPRKGAVIEAFAEAAFKLKPGQVSGPVKTEFGYHLIKVTEKKEAKEVSYEDVKEQVKENYITDESGKLIEKLRQEAKIELVQ